MSPQPAFRNAAAEQWQQHTNDQDIKNHETHFSASQAPQQ